jgi:beta-mannosidase
MHYMARRFYAPVTVINLADQASQGGTRTVRLVAVSDLPDPLTLQVEAHAVSMDGEQRLLWRGASALDASGAVTLVTLDCAALGLDEFLHVRWQDATGAVQGEDDFLPRFHKQYALATVAPRLTWIDSTHVRIEADAVCFFTTLETRVAGHFSDNGFTLLPGQARTIAWTGEPISAHDVRIRHLAQTY